MNHTLIGKVPPEWEDTTLADLCDRGGGGIQTGPFGSQLHASDYVDSGIPSVMPKDIGENVILEDSIARITPEDANRLSKYLLAEGDIVYSRRGDVERRALVRKEQEGWLCGTGCLRVRPGNSVNSLFLSYYLGHPQVRKWVVQHSVGATMPNLNTGILGQTPVILPDRSTQESIAAALGALDDKIAVNERINVLAEDLCRHLVTESKNRASLVTVEDICSLKKRQTNPSELETPLAYHYSLPAFDKGKLPELTDPKSIKSNKFIVASPSVLVSKLNPDIPRVWNVPKIDTIPNLASTEFLVLEPVTGISTHELWAVTSQPEFTRSLAARVTGTSKSHQRVRPAEVLATEVVDPRDLGPVRDQITTLSSRSIAAIAESRTLAELRDTLLPQLMSGKLRVKDAEKIVEDNV